MEIILLIITSALIQQFGETMIQNPWSIFFILLFIALGIALHS